MVECSGKVVFPAATISPFPCSPCTRHGVDVTRQAAAGFGCAAALEAERWLATDGIDFKAN